MKNKKIYLDEEEMAIANAYDRGELVSMPISRNLREQLRIVARNTLNKNKNMNIRVSERGMMLLKRKAAEKGLPYQTLASSVLYQYGSDRLVENRRGQS